MNIDQYSPQSGRFLKEDGTYINIADVLGGVETGQIADIEKHAAHSGRFIKEDGTCVNIADMIANGDIGGGGGSDSGSSDDSAPPIVETYNGQVIQSFISADRPLQSLKLFATTKQASTTGANLFDESEYGKKTLFGITAEWLQEEGCFLLNGTATGTGAIRMPLNIVAEKGAKYTLQNYYSSGKISVPDGGDAVSYFGASDTEDSSNNWLPCSLKEEDTTSTMQCNYSYITSFWFYITIGVVLNNYKIRVQLAKSSVSLPYEPYTGGIPSPNVDYPQEIQTISDFVVEVKNSMEEGATPQTLDITIPEQGFYGIPVSSGGNYTDASGKQWICDEFDFANKKFIKRIGRVSFDGSEDEQWGKGITSVGLTRFYTTLANGEMGLAECLCNRLIHRALNEVGSCFASDRAFFIYLEQSIDTVELLRDYLDTHPLDVIYPLETSVEYDLTNEQVEQFKKLKSYYGTTYIDNDAVPACNMQAKLVLDTKLYIDNKFTTLAGQILEMGV